MGHISRCGSLPRITKAKPTLSQAIEEEVQEQVAEQFPHGALANDLAMSALSEVDWMEIAESYLE